MYNTPTATPVALMAQLKILRARRLGVAQLDAEQLSDINDKSDIGLRYGIVRECETLGLPCFPVGS